MSILHSTTRSGGDFFILAFVGAQKGCHLHSAGRGGPAADRLVPLGVYLQWVFHPLVLMQGSPPSIRLLYLQWFFIYAFLYNGRLYTTILYHGSLFIL